jgi:hypothetical protein
MSTDQEEGGQEMNLHDKKRSSLLNHYEQHFILTLPYSNFFMYSFE